MGKKILSKKKAKHELLRKQHNLERIPPKGQMGTLKAEILMKGTELIQKGWQDHWAWTGWSCGRQKKATSQALNRRKLYQFCGRRRRIYRVIERAGHEFEEIYTEGGGRGVATVAIGLEGKCYAGQKPTNLLEFLLQ